MIDDIRDQQRQFRQACGKFATGITVLMVKVGAELHGMTANAFMSVSLDPLLVAVSVSKASKMHTYLHPNDVIFTISILHARQKMVAEMFGRPHRYPPMEPQFSVVNGGYPVVHDPAAWFLCQKDQSVDAGDHTIVVGRVHSFGEREHHPLVFYSGQYFSRLSDEVEEMVEFSLLEQ